MSSNPLIILTHEFFPHRGGIATYVEEIATAAAESGLDVEVWAQAASPDTPVKPWRFRLRRLPLSGSHDIICQLRLARELITHRRLLRSATVYLAEPGPMLTLMWLQFFSAFRPQHVLLTFHGSEIVKFHRNPFTRPLTKRLIRHAEKITTLSNYTRNLLCERFPEATAKTLITPGALRADFIESTSNPRPESGHLVILTVGRLHPRKGQMQTLEALAALPANIKTKIEYWIVGTGKKRNYKSRLQRRADQSDLKVKFLGDLPDNQLSAIYDQADIFALTSIEYSSSVEGFGLVYLEAAAHGLPVIAHAIGGVPEAVSEGRTGLLVSPHLPTELTKAFCRLISDADLRNKLGVAGRTWARHHSWANSAELLFGPFSPDSSP